MEVVFGISFLTFSTVKIHFAEKELTWKTYTTSKILPITKRVQIIGPKEFAKAVLDPNQEIFIILCTNLFVEPIKVYLDCKVQINALISDKALIILLAKYSDFENVFSKESNAVLSVHTEINTHAINLEKGKQTLYRSIYSLELKKLKTLKIYIKTNLVNSFLYLFKSPICAPILSDKKPNRTLQFCVNILLILFI